MTVLEKYRRAYLILRELENPRWTERERRELIDELRDQIELVWMTGELHAVLLGHSILGAALPGPRDAVAEQYDGVPEAQDWADGSDTQDSDDAWELTGR